MVQPWKAQGMEEGKEAMLDGSKEALAKEAMRFHHTRRAKTRRSQTRGAKTRRIYVRIGVLACVRAQHKKKISERHSRTRRKIRQKGTTLGVINRLIGA